MSSSSFCFCTHSQQLSFRVHTSNTREKILFHSALSLHAKLNSSLFRLNRRRLVVFIFIWYTLTYKWRLNRCIHTRFRSISIWTEMYMSKYACFPYSNVDTLFHRCISVHSFALSISHSLTHSRSHVLIHSQHTLLHTQTSFVMRSLSVKLASVSRTVCDVRPLFPCDRYGFFMLMMSMYEMPSAC